MLRRKKMGELDLLPKVIPEGYFLCRCGAILLLGEMSELDDVCRDCYYQNEGEGEEE
jgi:hypothetical protein